jgi:hypothetical protein
MSEELKLNPDILETFRDKDLSPEEHAAFELNHAKPVSIAENWEQQMTDGRVRWKYRVRKVEITDLQTELNAFGRMGWEIAHIEPDRFPLPGHLATRVLIVFKTPYHFEQPEITNE